MHHSDDLDIVLCSTKLVSGTWLMIPFEKFAEKSLSSSSVMEGAHHLRKILITSDNKIMDDVVTGASQNSLGQIT
jgi:hypothetical protein